MIPTTSVFQFNDESHSKELEAMFHKSALKDFASNWILFVINETMGRGKFSKDLLSTVYIRLVENKKLSRRWRVSNLTNLNLLEWLEK